MAERTGFEAIVQQGLDNGMDQAAAEGRARELLYGDATEGGAAATPEQLWTQLQRTWEKRDGMELVDVLEEINAMLDRGLINGDQFGELLARAYGAPPEVTPTRY